MNISKDALICIACSAPIVLQYAVVQSCVRLQNALMLMQRYSNCFALQYSDIRIDAVS